MKHNRLIRLIAVCMSLCLLLLSVGVLSSCGHKETPVLTLKGHSISTNVYQFLLARVRGTMSRSGLAVNNSDFWETVISADGLTYDDYIRQRTLNDAKLYLAALVMFDEEGLSLSKERLNKIDEEIDGYVRDAGSKSALNNQLSAYGINMDILRDVYIMEAKIAALQAHLYGANGGKIDPAVKSEYLNEYAVGFKQVLIRSFDYVYEKDANGDEIYYLPSENNAKVNNVAYDTVKGSPRVDEHGKTIVDDNGDTVYYLSGGKIAYDTEKGVRALEYDEKGIAKTVKYSPEELAKHKSAGEEIMAKIEKGDYAAFEAILEEYEISNDDAFVTDGKLCFLYTTGDNQYDYLNDIADILKESDFGQVRMVESEYGYNVVMKYKIPEDAPTNPDYKDWFADLTTRVTAWLFHKKAEPLMKDVTMDADAFKSVPSMKEIGNNIKF